MRHLVTLLCALLVFGTSGLSTAQRGHHRASKVESQAYTAPKQENQFQTVDEFVKAHRAAGATASAEGYMVVAFRASDGGARLALADSVDHVLSARDANGAAKSGGWAIVSASAARRHPGWGFSAKGLQKYAMYTGSGSAQKVLHDTVPKIRVTGRVSGRNTINPVTRIEYADENGEWKLL